MRLRASAHWGAYNVSQKVVHLKLTYQFWFEVGGIWIMKHSSNHLHRPSHQVIFYQVICHQVWTSYHLWQWMPPWKKLSAETHMTWLNLWPYFLEMVIKCTAWSMAAKLLTPWSIQFHKTRLIFNSTNELMWSALSHLWQTNEPFFVLLWLILVRNQPKWIVRMASDCANFWGEAVPSHQCQQATEFIQVWNSLEEVGEASTLQQKKIIKTFAIW